MPIWRSILLAATNISCSVILKVCLASISYRNDSLLFSVL